MNKINLQPGYKARIVQLGIDETMFRYVMDIKEEFIYIDSLVLMPPNDYHILKVENDEEPFNISGFKMQAVEMLKNWLPFDVNVDDLVLKPGKYWFPQLATLDNNDAFTYTLPYPYYTEPVVVDGKRKFSWFMDDSIIKMRSQFAYQGHISIDGLGEVEWNADGFTTAHEHLQTWGDFIREQMNLSGLFPDGAPVYTLEGNRLSFEYDATLPETTYNYYPFTFDPIFVPGYKPAYALILVKS